MSAGARFTDAQRRALDLTRHAAVSAGAGSGKTLVLTERYVRALERLRSEPRPLRRVVAITFSRKAAAEMRTRVRLAVAGRLQSAARERDDELVDFWRRVRDELHTARITTIDAFSASLLREHPLDAGVDPGFEVVEAAEARLTAREALGVHLSHVSATGTPDDAQLSALNRLLGRYRRFEVMDMLGSLLLDRALATSWVHALPRTDVELDARLDATREELSRRFGLGVRRIVERTSEGLREAIPRAAARPGTDKLLDRLGPVDRFLRGCIDETIDDESFLAGAGALLNENSQTGNWDARGFGNLGRAAFWGGKDAVMALRAHLGELANITCEELYWYAPFDEASERAGLEAERDLGTLYGGVVQRYRSLLGWPRRLDFAALALGAEALVSKAAVAKRIASEIDHLLVDEFQDTSVVQWNLLERILEASAGEDDGFQGDDRTNGSAATRSPRIRVFVVGDEKQAIYEFRGGRVEVFRHVSARICEWGGGHVGLDDNFRALGNPLGVVNAVFSHVFALGRGETYEAAPQALVSRRQVVCGSGGVELLLSDAGAVKDVDSLREIEADRIAAEIEALVERGETVVDPDTGDPRAATHADIAVIVFYKRLYANLEAAFAARRIPFHVLGGLGFYQSREVVDAVALLAALTDRRDAIALAAVLRSPFGNVTDPALYAISRESGVDLHEKLQRARTGGDSAIAAIADRLDAWRERVGRVPTSTLLDDAMRESGYLAACRAMPGGERRFATVQKLLEIVRRFETRHGIRPVELGEWLRTQHEEVHDEPEETESGEGDGVTVMTIHRAKGSEFPIVIVPGLLEAGMPGEMLPVRRLHDMNGARIGLKVPVELSQFKPEHTDMVRTSRFRLLDLAIAERRRAEEKRVLYVAMTRARDRLVLSTRTPSSSGALISPALNTKWTPLDWLRTLGPLDAAMSGTPEPGVELGSATVDVRAPVQIERPALAPDRGLLEAIDVLLGETPPAPPRGSARSHAPPAPVVVPVTAIAELAVSPPRFYNRMMLGLDVTGGQPQTIGGTPGADPIDAVSLGREVHRRLALWPSRSAPNGDDLAGRHVAAFTSSATGREIEAAGGGRTEIAFALAFPGGRLDGTIDRLYRSPEGVWTIVDYKTNHLEPGVTLEALATSKGHDVQLLLYAMATARILELETSPVCVVIAYTDPGHRERSRELTRTLDAAQRPSLELLGSIVRGALADAHVIGGRAFEAEPPPRAAFTLEGLERFGVAIEGRA